MKKVILTVVMMVCGASGVQAGESATAFTQCLLNNTTEADRAVMTKWVFSSLSNHPSLNDMASIAPSVRSGADQEMAQLVERFMYQKCTAQLKTAVKNEGPMAIQMGIQSYVQVAGREIMQHPSIAASITGLATQMDMGKLLQVLMSN